MPKGKSDTFEQYTISRAGEYYQRHVSRVCLFVIYELLHGYVYTKKQEFFNGEFGSTKN
jgi:5-methylcytosine-specific restriction endonuclease McrBC regulatory subunit McrC